MKSEPEIFDFSQRIELLHGNELLSKENQGDTSLMLNEAFRSQFSLAVLRIVPESKRNIKFFQLNRGAWRLTISCLGAGVGIDQERLCSVDVLQMIVSREYRLVEALD
ncbi:MAG: hypothetical protein M3539_13125 [Acidobacteriota bacterium]|nr:hypothetical protein [Acidobacteriota bacterium]